MNLAGFRRHAYYGAGRAVAGGAPPPAPPILAAHDPSWTPATAEAVNPNPITVGVRFTVATEKVVRGLAMFGSTTIGGTYTIGFWQTTTDDDPNGTGTGTLLTSAAVAAASLTAGAWNYPALPFTFQPGLVYSAGYWTSSGRFPLTANAFNGAAVTGNGVTLLQAGSDPNPPLLGSMTNGVFHDDTTSAGLAYPTTSFNFSDYGVDLWL